MKKQNASLDTSFWDAGYRVHIILPYLFRYFDVFFTPSVESEVTSGDPERPHLTFPQAELFRVFVQDGRLRRELPKRPIELFGLGEREAIALAKERDWVLLINDRRPLAFARNLGLRCLCVPDFCALLYADQIVTLEAALGMLHMLRNKTSVQLLDSVRAVIRQIAMIRGEWKDGGHADL